MLPMRQPSQQRLMMDLIPRRILLAGLPLPRVVSLHLGQPRHLARVDEVGFFGRCPRVWVHGCVGVGFLGIDCAARYVHWGDWGC